MLIINKCNSPVQDVGIHLQLCFRNRVILVVSRYRSFTANFFQMDNTNLSKFIKKMCLFSLVPLLSFYLGKNHGNIRLCR